MKLMRALLAGVLATAAATQPTIAKVASASVERADGTLVVRWSASAPVDVYIAEGADAAVGAARLVSDNDRDGRHVLPDSSGKRTFVLLRDESDGSFSRVAERLLPLERGSNFRDLGGYAAAGGKHLRWGKIYRSAAMPLLSDADYRYLDRLAIATIVDLRSVEEREVAPTLLGARTGARYIAHDYPASRIFERLGSGAPVAMANQADGFYREWPVSLAPQYRAIFAALLEGKGALVYHCSAGQDRTGVGTALVLAALGVPREAILADYHLTTAFRRPEYELPAIDAARFPGNVVAASYGGPGSATRKPRPLYDANGKAHLAATFDEIDTRWGSVERYLDEVLGIDAVDLAALRAGYLE